MQNGECKTDSLSGAHARDPRGGRDIQDRTFRSGVCAAKRLDSLPRILVGAVFARQTARCGTGIGANVTKAEAAQRRAEFIRRMNIRRSETRETRSWLREIRGTGHSHRSELDDLSAE
ncbi:MAG: four helix bundle protein [Phycisphaerae bacterium]|jgi:four helix bundle protein